MAGGEYPQTEAEWEDLRVRLCSQYPEDQVQATLMHLLEAQATGYTLTTEPIYWCRQDAAHNIVDERTLGRIRATALETYPPAVSTPPAQEGYVEAKEIASQEDRTLSGARRLHRRRRRRQAALRIPIEATRRRRMHEA